MTHVEMIGFMAASLTTFAYMPQAIKTIRTRSTKDISLGMYFMLFFGIIAWGTYGYLILSWPIILSNIITIMLVIPVLVMKIRYR